MADIYDNPVFAQIAAIAECVCGKFIENELPPLCFCGIIAGDAPYDATGIGDGCSEDEEEGCGQVWVRLVNAYPSASVGTADISVNNCASKGFGFDLEIGAMRCIALEEKGGVIPAEDMLEAVQLQIADMLTMRDALNCCADLYGEDFVIGQYSPIGPAGGLVGGTWMISVSLVV